MKKQEIYILFLRVSLGILFFYSGIVKVLDPNWSAGGYLKTAKTFSWFYHLLLGQTTLPIINFINEWGLTLLGLSLLLGIFVRFSSFFGVTLMALYYLPGLSFPFVGKHSFLIDEHIIYIGVLLFLSEVRAGRIWGLEKWCSGLPICSRYPAIRKMLG